MLKNVSISFGSTFNEIVLVKLPSKRYFVIEGEREERVGLTFKSIEIKLLKFWNADQP